MKYVGDEKPSLESLTHHGVKGMKWGHRMRQRETAKLQKESAKLQKSSDHLHRLADRKPMNTKEKIQRAALDVGNFGIRKLTDANLNQMAGEVDAKHQKVLARLNTPEGERRMKTATKAKIAVGGVVAAHMLYNVGGLTLGSLVAVKRAGRIATGPKAIGAAAQALKYAKKANGAFKVTSL